MKLQIYVYGPKEAGFLDIDPNTVLQMESLSDIFDEDLSIGDYSLPADFPFTDNNRRLLGFPERLENFTSTAPRYWKCIVYDDMIPELPVAKLTMLEKIGKFNYTTGKFTATISGSKGLFGSYIKTRTMQDLYYGGQINWAPGTSSRQFATEVMHGGYPQYSKMFGFGPVAIEDFIQKDRPDFNDEFLAKDVVNWVEPSGSDWLFTNPAGSATDSTRTVPFFYLKFILTKIFQEFGYTLAGDFMSSSDFDDVVVFNNYALDKYGAGVDYNTFINPSNHVPNVPIIDFLKGIFSFFNMFPVFGATNVQLIYREANLKSRNVLSLNDVAGAEFDNTYESQTSQNGYKLDYTWDSNDGYHGDRVKDGQMINLVWDGVNNEWVGTWSPTPTDKNFVATVDLFTQLGNLNIGRQLTTDDIAYVNADNLFYVVADATIIPIKWDVYSENLGSYVTGNGDRSVDFKISTLCTYAEQNPDTGLYEKRNYVGTRQPGSYINNSGVRVPALFETRIFYLKQYNVGGTIQPITFNWNRDINNNSIEKYSLAWAGKDGIAANFHATWQSMRNNLQTVKTTIRGTQKVLNDLNAYNLYEINGVIFLPYKSERTIPMKSTIDLYISPI